MFLNHAKPQKSLKLGGTKPRGKALKTSFLFWYRLFQKLVDQMDIHNHKGYEKGFKLD